MTRRLNRALLLMGLLAGLPAWWLLVENHPGKPAPEPLPLASLRAMADSLPGPRPRAIEMEIPAERRVFGNLVAAGTGFATRWVALAAWRLDVDGGPPVVIGRALDRPAALALGYADFDPAAARRIAAALAAPGAVRIPAAEPPGPRPRAVAPGVVVVPANGLRPGAAMVYVHMASGGEVLFTLGVSLLDVNWRELRAPSRWLNLRRHDGDRAAMFRWLATIRAWRQQNPALLVIPGADADWLAHHSTEPPFAGQFPG